jgi:hypothetical protein
MEVPSSKDINETTSQNAKDRIYMFDYDRYSTVCMRDVLTARSSGTTLSMASDEQVGVLEDSTNPSIDECKKPIKKFHFDEIKNTEALGLSYSDQEINLASASDFNAGQNLKRINFSPNDGFTPLLSINKETSVILYKKSSDLAPKELSSVDDYREDSILHYPKSQSCSRSCSLVHQDFGKK